MTSLMESEASSVPEIIATQLESNQLLWQNIADQFRKKQPDFVMTLARGSSDHASTFAKYLFEIRLGLMTCSVAPSVFTLYNSTVDHAKSVVFGISQSGKSPDLYETMQTIRQSGALGISLVNNENSSLADVSDFVVPLRAKAELSVAATKSYIASLVALVQFVAVYSRDQNLLNALDRLPGVLSEATKLDWSGCYDYLVPAKNAYVIGRGYGFPVAEEAALKFKETAGLHAEAFSSAEVLHGPFALVEPSFSTFVFAQNDETLKGTKDIISKMTSLGAKTMVALSETRDRSLRTGLNCSLVLPLPESLHPLLDPIVSIQAFYMMVANLAILRGKNPDKPRNLKKVTETR